MVIKQLEPLFDPESVPPNLAGRSKVDEKALQKVISLYDRYKKMRNFTQGGKDISITKEWDEKYRLYKCIRNSADHNYTTGIAKVFAPLARKQINVIDSEISNALFSREDYFKVDGIADKPENMEAAHKAYCILKHYSDNSIMNYPSQIDLAAKQCGIYGFTCAETVWYKKEYTTIRKASEKIPITDEKTGEPIIMMVEKEDGSTQKIPQTRTKIFTQSEHVIEEFPLIVARDIYRLYINHLSNSPMDEDIIYRDAMSSQKLLELAEKGVYNKKAVTKLLEMNPQYNNNRDSDDGGEDGKSFYDEASISTGDRINNKYEIMRFQGLFSTKDPATGLVIQDQYLIDIGERSQVLRVQKNPFWGKYKTFSCVSYDTLISESYTDGVVDNGTKTIQYEINDKENQSLDAVSFNLNSPWLKSKRSKIKSSEIATSRKRPNYVIETNDMDGLKKVQESVDVSHISNEIVRLVTYADGATGATNVLSGQPTGTQADRSGKSLGIIQVGAKSQFSKFIRKMERDFIEPLLGRAWDMINQFSHDTVPVQYFVNDKDGVEKPRFAEQSVAEVVGDLRIRVSAGSEYVKNQQLVESILNFISIAGTREEWMMSLDSTPMLKEIARSMPFDMSTYVNPDNAMSQLMAQNKQLLQVLQQYQGTLKAVGGEAQRLQSELKQTNRAQMANPSPIDQMQNQQKGA